MKPYLTIIKCGVHWMDWSTYKTQAAAVDGRKDLLKSANILDVKIIDTRRKDSLYYRSKKCNFTFETSKYCSEYTNCRYCNKKPKNK